ncbi:unnamed protein product [Caenorhabditis auriculariae]|uniref:Uncharacterized protein n=1 Tax=Caenorhabditis auriculariae TaxID=2777116 RepID=A0A8S1HGT5_9PELO|nr:unnamed protein product [Caenorhabditis auriculariae]
MHYTSMVSFWDYFNRSVLFDGSERYLFIPVYFDLLEVKEDGLLLLLSSVLGVEALLLAMFFMFGWLFMYKVLKVSVFIGAPIFAVWIIVQGVIFFLNWNQPFTGVYAVTHLDFSLAISTFFIILQNTLSVPQWRETIFSMIRRKEMTSVSPTIVNTDVIDSKVFMRQLNSMWEMQAPDNPRASSFSKITNC